MEITASKGTFLSAEQVFDGLLRDSVTEVFIGVLGRIAGPALLEAVKAHTSLDIKDLPSRVDLLDQALKAHMGSTAKVLERKILKTLTSKTATRVAVPQSNQFDFASEVDNVRKQFMKRKQAGKTPQTLE